MSVDERNKKRAATLLPVVEQKALQLIDNMEAKGVKLALTSAYRSAAEQNRLYAKGRSAPGKKVTNAKGGYSWHNFRVAFDVVFCTKNGGVSWKGDWEAVGSEGKHLGLEWGGDWKKFKDRPHFQLVGGCKTSDARGNTPKWRKHVQAMGGESTDAPSKKGLAVIAGGAKISAEQKSDGRVWVPIRELVDAGVLECDTKAWPKVKLSKA